MATGKEDSRKKKPTITLPPRPSMESLYGVTGFSPGPMTLVSSFFAEESNYQSFSQLLAGAMASPLARPSPIQTPSFWVDNGRNGDDKDGDEKGSFSFKDNRPRSLVVADNSPFFTVPTGLSPSGLLNSPGFFPPQSPFGMSHQQALAQVTAQAVLAQSNMQTRAEYQPAQVPAPAESLAHHQSLTLDEASQKQTQPANSDPQSSLMETSEVSQSDGKHLNPSLAVDKPADDGYNWRKYGQKPIKGSEFPRSYYKCTHLNCPVKKKVERSSEGQIAQIIYKNEHNHEKPQPSRRAKDGSDVNENINSQAKPDLVLQGQNVPAHSVPGNNQVSIQAAPIKISESSDSEELGDADNRKERDDDEPNPKRRNIAGEPEITVSHKTVTEPKIIVQTRSEVDLLDDGYRWRKYGQKVVKGNPHPRSYYKCTSAGCNVRKHVERAPNDPKAVITTYEGKHNHDVPASRNSSQTAANNAPQLKAQNTVTQKHPLLKDMEFGNHDQRPVLLRLKEEQVIV
ncbi:probable WRKY transcription factor 4 [Mangifera indica]|uniref:probable WRKY transcription factor 4 n=1 Tax=Mangifera indica TaxID=29780 RepID=UPI001CF9FC15|nr:probable WRKY transcription factor 4 [Mangifera indica]